MGDVSSAGTRPVSMASAVPWFPLVGAGIGSIIAGTFLLVGRWLDSAGLAAAIAVSLGLLITGAFHHDGLADMADAFGGGWTVERRMEILKDSRLGTYGTSALVMALVLKVIAIAEMHERGWLAFRVIVAAHVLSRSLAIVAMVVAPTAGDGMGASYMADLGRVGPWVGAVGGALAAAALIADPTAVAVSFVAAVVVAGVVVALSIRKINGITGDVLGAIQVVTALAVLIPTPAVLL